MDVLVIGGSGQVGSELCRLLRDANISYQAPDRDQLDLEQHRSVAKKIKSWQPDIVINTAGYRDPGHADYEPSRCFSINRDCVANLAKACDKAGAALIQISSWRVFDGTKREPYTTKDSPNPVGVLGNSYWQGEQQVRQHCARHIILRLSWIISHRGHNRVTRILNGFQPEQAMAGTCPNHRGNPTTAEDVARVLLAITQQLSCNIDAWGTYHYASAEPIDEFTLAEVTLAEASQYQQPPENPLPIDERENIETINSCLDNTRLRHTFGIHSRPWRSALARLVRSYYEDRKDR